MLLLSSNVLAEWNSSDTGWRSSLITGLPHRKQQVFHSNVQSTDCSFFFETYYDPLPELSASPASPTDLFIVKASLHAACTQTFSGPESRYSASCWFPVDWQHLIKFFMLFSWTRTSVIRKATEANQADI